MELRDGDYVLGIWQVVQGPPNPVEILFTVVRPFGEKLFTVEARVRIVMDDLDPHDPSCKDVKRFKQWTMPEETTDDQAIGSMRGLMKKAKENFETATFETLVQSSDQETIIGGLMKLPGATATKLDPKVKEDAERLRELGIEPDPLPT